MFSKFYKNTYVFNLAFLVYEARRIESFGLGEDGRISHQNTDLRDYNCAFFDRITI